MRAVIAGMALAGMGLAGCAASTSETPAPTQTAPVAATGPEQMCVLVQSIRSTQVRDDQTIDFFMRDGTVLRNTLPARCPQLGFERAFSYSTTIPQLCSVDIITVLVQAGRVRQGASCGLGKFTPIAPPARK